jgi:hypothetical protein
MDAADITSLHDFTEEVLARFRNESHPEVKHTGQCLNCGEPTENGSLYCDSNCQDDYEHAQRIHQMRATGRFTNERRWLHRNIS